MSGHALLRTRYQRSGHLQAFRHDFVWCQSRAVASDRIVSRPSLETKVLTDEIETSRNKKPRSCLLILVIRGRHFFRSGQLADQLVRIVDQDR